MAKTTDLGKLIDIAELRSARRSLDRRQGGDRYDPAEFVQTSCEIEDPSGKKWIKVELVDVSETGCGFRLDPAKVDRIRKHRTWPQVPIRLRFGAEIRLIVSATILSCREERKGPRRKTFCGTRVEPGQDGHAAFVQFAKFLDALSLYRSREEIKNVAA